jgi:hypothetical protein
MAEGAMYYAIVNEFSTREKPFGVVRRLRQNDGQRDEVFSRDLTWKRTNLLYSAERGDLTNDLIPISEEEADRIVARIQAASEATG